MEKAIFLVDSNQIQSVASILGKFTRLYCGEEYCGRRIPSKAQVEKTAGFCLENGLELTFMTPVLTAPEIEKLMPVLDWLMNHSEQHPELKMEICFNDWGLFYQMKDQKNFNPVLGPLLVKQKRDPGFLFDSDREEVSDVDLQHIHSCNIDSNSFIREFVEKQFSRVELVNTWQGTDLSINLPRSLHLPIVPVSITRYCKWAAREAGSANASTYIDCRQSCRGKAAAYKNEHVTIFLYGNLQYYVNNEIRSLPERVDRLVVFPIDHDYA